MANEITLNATFEYNDLSSADIIIQIAGFTVNVTNKKFIHGKFTANTSTTAIDVGPVTTLGYYIFVNRDTTNFVSLQTSNGGTSYAKLDPASTAYPLRGGFAIGRFGAGVTAPYAIADTAACLVEYLIVNT